MWYSAARASEDNAFWDKMFGLGVDFFYSDKPLEAMQARELH